MRNLLSSNPPPLHSASVMSCSVMYLPDASMTGLFHFLTSAARSMFYLLLMARQPCLFRIFGSKSKLLHLLHGCSLDGNDQPPLLDKVSNFAATASHVRLICAVLVR